eukprot:gene28283-37323_t
MTFRAVVIIGDSKRKVGVGIGRADDVNMAIDKAILNGKKNLINVPLTMVDSVPHVVKASYGACHIMLRPASPGTGVIAGGSVRTVLELAGIKNILAKQFGSSFNYFYTIVFWDPEKISEQLRKASVSVLNVTPGKETVSYLENVVRSTSILGGVAYEVQKTI